MKRYASIDTAKGFGIFAMLIVHTLTQQLGRGNHEAFLPVIQSINPYALISMAPFIILGLWGSFFTLLTCLTTVMRMLNVAENRRSELHRIVESRIVIGFFILLTEKIAYHIKGHKMFEYGRFVVPSIGFRYHSDTTDSIVYVSIILSFLLLVLLKIPSLVKPKFLIIFFALMGFISLYYSDRVNLKCEELYIQFVEDEQHILRLLVTKISRGRFKLSQTFAFGCLGIVFGAGLYTDPTLKQLRMLTASLFFISITIFIVLLINDWTFLLEFVSEDVPYEIQFFNLGGQCLLIQFFIRNIDYGSPSQKIKWRKGTVWLRRYGVVSLTLYALGPVPQDILFEKILPYWGVPIIINGTIVELGWDAIQIFYMFFLVVVMWEIVGIVS